MRARAAAPDGGGDLYIVAEKILSPGEALPRNWAIAGTTGYEFLNLLNGIFVDRSQARAMEHLYARLIKERPPSRRSSTNASGSSCRYRWPRS